MVILFQHKQNMSSIPSVEDEYDEYNYEQDKLVNSGHSGNITNKTILLTRRFDISTFLRVFVNVFFFLFDNTGKNRTKKEASEHTNHFDPSGHSRKLSTKLQNTQNNKKEENLKPHPVTKK